MPRAIWKGQISFGLVTIPVALYPGVTPERLDLDLLDRRDRAPIGYQKVNKRTGEPVPAEAIVKAYKANGRYVVLTDEDLRRASPERTQRVDILSFVDPAEIPPLLFDRPHYLAPAAKSDKPYALLRDALRDSGRVGIASVVIRTRQYLAALIPQDRLLVLNLLRYPEELRDPRELALPGTNLKAMGVVDAERNMARRLIDEMTGPFDASRYKDEYRAELLAFIARKAGRPDAVAVEAPPRRPRRAPTDIMTLLKESLDHAQAGRRHRGRPRRARAA